jgi:hypothetical protein
MSKNFCLQGKREGKREGKRGRAKEDRFIF